MMLVYRKGDVNIDNEKYMLLIGYKEEYKNEGINPFWVEIRNLNRTDDETEKILMPDIATNKEAEQFCNEYMKQNSKVEYFDYGDF